VLALANKQAEFELEEKKFFKDLVKDVVTDNV
jgi:hypothetical protein